MQRLSSIQVLRFIAAGMVLIGHTLMEARKLGILSLETYRWLDRFPWGSGVDLFFIISGFIIAFVGAQLPTGFSAAAYFLYRRFARIAPIYWFYTGLMILAILLFPTATREGPLSLERVIKSLFFWPNDLVRGVSRPILGQGWTLNYEMFFYMIAAVIIGMTKHLRFWLIAACIFIAWIVGRLSNPASLVYNFLGFSIILEFILGLALYELFKRQIVIERMTAMASIVAGLLLLTFFHVAFAEWDELTWRFVTRGIPSFLIAFGMLFWPHSTSEAQSQLRGSAVLLGDASYSLYLSHPFVIIPLAMAWSKLGLGAPGVFIAIAIASCLIAALLSYMAIEQVLNHLCRIGPRPLWWQRWRKT